MSAAQKVGVASPSASAIRNQTEFPGTEEMHRRVTAINAQSIEDEASAQYLRWASGQAMLGGDIGMIGPLLGKPGSFASAFDGAEELAIPAPWRN